MNRRALMLGSACVGLISGGVLAGGPDVIAERLVSPSVFEHEICQGPCDCVPRTLMGVLRGRFVLVREAADPLFENFAVEQVDLRTVVEGQEIVLTGRGRYRIGGEVAVVHELTLDVLYADVQALHFESGVRSVTTMFPEIAIEATTGLVGCSIFTMRIASVPACLSDFNGNGEIESLDVSLFLNRWFESLERGTLMGDFSLDGVVNSNDVAEFLNQWFVDLVGC